MKYPTKLSDTLKEVEMNDITAPNFVEIRISSNAKTVWINTEEKCIMRLNKIGKLFLVDDREKKVDEK